MNLPLLCCIRTVQTCWLSALLLLNYWTDASHAAVRYSVFWNDPVLDSIVIDLALV